MSLFRKDYEAPLQAQVRISFSNELKWEWNITIWVPWKKGYEGDKYNIIASSWHGRLREQIVTYDTPGEAERAAVKKAHELMRLERMEYEANKHGSSFLVIEGQETNL